MLEQWRYDERYYRTCRSQSIATDRFEVSRSSGHKTQRFRGIWCHFTSFFHLEDSILMPRAGLSRRHFLYFAVAFVCTLGFSAFTVLNLWLLGRRSVQVGNENASGPQSPRRHRVTGGSMAPTLWGEHYEVTCPTCKVPFKFDASPTSSLVQDASPQIRCWHCGEEFDRPSGPTLPGDIVDAIPIDDSTQLNRGQLVVIRVHDELHLKRLLGIPGDTISLADKAVTPLQLSINGEPTTSSEVTIPVDRDAFRTESRWSSSRWSSSPWPTWQRIDATWQCTATQTQSPALIYTHHNIHDFNKVTAIMDDCPANALIARPLYPVSKLQLRFRITCSAAIQLITTLGNRECQLGTHNLVLRGPSGDVSISVIAKHDNSTVRIDGLELDRFIDYRMRRTDDQSKYPIKLTDDEYFIIGDNVPISIDSRTYGPIQRNQILTILQ